MLAFDFRCDPLQDFLKQVASALNGHSERIAKLENQMNTRSSD